METGRKKVKGDKRLEKKIKEREKIKNRKIKRE